MFSALFESDCFWENLLFYSGINVVSITADISQANDVQKMIETIVSKWGTVHVACNNAGVNMNSVSEDTTVDEWDKTFNVNLRGTFLCCQVCLSGDICNILDYL